MAQIVTHLLINLMIFSMALSNRLSAIAKLIEKDSVVADIGTDHALLPIFLRRNNIAKSIIACDINEGPLKVAKKNVLASGVDNITLRLGNGLAPLKRGEVSCSVIAGMGGEVIKQILDACEFAKDLRFILQPMSSANDLRRYLSQNGYNVKSETAVEDSGRIYAIICAEHGGNMPCYEGYEMYIGKMRGGNQAERRYIMNECDRIAKLCEDIKNVPRKAELLDKSKKCLKKIEQVIKEW